MEFLSWLFFCLSPFALFCSENGNGLILCPLFIALGFIFKAIGDKPKKVSYTNDKGEKCSYKIKKYKNGDAKVLVDVEPQNFWEWHYKDAMRKSLIGNDSITDELMALNDKEARRWATTVCRYNNAWIPTESTQEQIARANGFVTQQMVKECNRKIDRLQIGKYILLLELIEKYDSIKIGKGGRERCCFPSMEIKKDRDKMRAANDRPIRPFWVEDEYNRSIREVWGILSEEEKWQATKWIEEYEKKLMEQVNEYVEGKRHSINVKIDD